MRSTLGETSRMRPGWLEASLKPKRRFAAFISHCKGDAAMEARFLQTEIERLIGHRCFIDSDYLRNLSNLEEHVRESNVLVLVPRRRSHLRRPASLPLPSHPGPPSEPSEPSEPPRCPAPRPSAPPSCSSLLTRPVELRVVSSRLLLRSLVLLLSYNPRMCSRAHGCFSS